MVDQLPDKIDAITNVTDPTIERNELDRPLERVAPKGEEFSALMNQDLSAKPKTTVQVVEGAQKPNLLEQVSELNRKVDAVSKASPEDLVRQAHSVIAQIEEVKSKLATPDLELKGSVQTLLRNKLSHIDESLKVALNRAGVEYTPQPETVVDRPNPIDRFLGFLTHGQYQLQRISQEVQQMHLNDKELSPANMLAIQIKVGYVTQELEFFTNLLNKALESTKTIMNVQV